MAAPTVITIADFPLRSNLTATRDGEIAGLMSWQPSIHVDFLGATDHDPRTLARMFRAFREHHRGRTITLQASDENAEMMRFIELIGAERAYRFILKEK